MKKILFALAAMILVLSACAPAATATPTPPVVTGPTSVPTVAEPTATAVPPLKTITIGTADFYPIHGMTIDTDDAASMSAWGVLETLLKVGPDGKIVASLAESWSQLDDTTWQFKLRQGVSFTNGEPFNAAAVVNSLNYIKNSPTPPRGFTAATFSSIEAVDDYTVNITTAKLDALLPNRLTNYNTGILAPSAYTAASGPVNFFNTGTGPFILTESVPEQSLTLLKNPDYWGGPVNIDKAVVLLIPDGQTRSTMLQTGEIDLAIHLPIAQLPILEQKTDITLYHFVQQRTNTLYLNLSRKPFSELKVRQAVAYAIDRQALVDAVLEGVGTPAKGPFASYEAWTNPSIEGLPYDPDKAKQLLTEAGYKAGDLAITLMTYPDRAELPPLAVAIQGMLGAVGINANVSIAPYASESAGVLAGDFDLFILSRSHVLESYDPNGFFGADYSCTGSFNIAHYCDPQFDTLLASSASTIDLTARYAIYGQLQTMLDESVASVFLNYTELINGSGNRVLNYQPYPLERFTLTPQLDVVP